MKHRMIGLVIAGAVLLSALPVFSQGAAGGEGPGPVAPKKEEKDPSKLWVDLSGVMYLEWVYNSGFKYTGSGSWGKIPRWGLAGTITRSAAEY